MPLVHEYIDVCFLIWLGHMFKFSLSAQQPVIVDKLVQVRTSGEFSTFHKLSFFSLINKQIKLLT